MVTVHSQSITLSGSHTHTCMHAYTLWMWNIIMHETGPMSVSYEPAMKPLVDKSPPTGVQEFGGLMKKSCWAGRSRPGYGVSKRPIEAPTGGELWSIMGGSWQGQWHGFNTTELSGNLQQSYSRFSWASTNVWPLRMQWCTQLGMVDMLCACECTVCVVWFNR